MEWKCMCTTVQSCWAWAAGAACTGVVVVASPGPGGIAAVAATAVDSYATNASAKRGRGQRVTHYIRTNNIAHCKRLHSLFRLPFPFSVFIYSPRRCLFSCVSTAAGRYTDGGKDILNTFER